MLDGAEDRPNLPPMSRVFRYLGLLILSASTALAEDEPFPGYAAECGYSIVNAATPNVSLAVIDELGRRVIILDPVLSADTEVERRRFLVAHECAHHRMDHTGIASRQARLRSAKVIRDQELSADCWAAETLARKGFERTIQIMADRFYRAGLYSPGGGYPAGIQRSTIIIHCAETGRTARLRDRNNAVK